MVPATGAGAAAVPAETQMLLLESRDEAGSAAAERSAVYALMLPILDGDFRASLQGSPENELQFCLESGEPCLPRPTEFQCSRTRSNRLCEACHFGKDFLREKMYCSLLVGDPEAQTMETVDAVFINSGDNPFKLMKESIK
jgi:hypothetical protein